MSLELEEWAAGCETANYSLPYTIRHELRVVPRRAFEQEVINSDPFSPFSFSSFLTCQTLISEDYRRLFIRTNLPQPNAAETKYIFNHYWNIFIVFVHPDERGNEEIPSASVVEMIALCDISPSGDGQANRKHGRGTKQNNTVCEEKIAVDRRMMDNVRWM